MERRKHHHHHEPTNADLAWLLHRVLKNQARDNRHLTRIESRVNAIFEIVNLPPAVPIIPVRMKVTYHLATKE